MLHRLCEPPVNSFEFQPCDHTPQAGALTLCFGTENPCCPQSSTHRLRPGLPGYLILFAPHAFVPQRQKRSSLPPSPPAFLTKISTHFTTPPIVPLAPTYLETPSTAVQFLVELGDFTPDWRAPPTLALSPVIPNNARTSSYRGCWHEVSRGFLWG